MVEDSRIRILLVGVLASALVLGSLYLSRKRRSSKPPQPPAVFTFEPDPFYLPFLEEGEKVKMGVKALDENQWIEIDETYFDQMKLKKQLANEKRDEILVSRQGPLTELAKREVWELLVDYLPQRFPTFFYCDHAAGTFHNFLTGDVYDLKAPGDDLLAVAGQIVQEDFCILEDLSPPGTYEGYVLTAGFVAFPLRWTLRGKWMQLLQLVHQPVKPFMDNLVNPVTKLLHSMTVKNPVWRTNWALFDDLESSLDLYTPTPSVERALKGPRSLPTDADDMERLGNEIFLRVERQTLRRLPRSNAILFTIRTYQRPIKELLRFPDALPQLIQCIENMHPDFIPYKNRDNWGEAALRYLRKHSPPKPAP